ncbi:MAG: NAD(+) diphosphatase [Phocaeicola sp.]
MNEETYNSKSYWFAFYQNQFLVEQIGDSYRVPCQEKPPTELPKSEEIYVCGELEGIPCKAYALTEEYNADSEADTAIVPNSMPIHPIDEHLGEESIQKRLKLVDLRASYDILPFDEYYKAGKGAELLHWERNSRFCPACGTETQRISAIGKKCKKCHQEFYPHIAPAMIVRIRKGDSILLVRAKNFRGTFKGLVAGFVESGESLEECVHREVLEETGLTIQNVSYFGSQPWPYPNVLMIGFTADYKGGELKLQEEELTSGAFFTKENMPELPRKLSLARQLIDDWLKEE